jgi:hypothetical protein
MSAERNNQTSALNIKIGNSEEKERDKESQCGDEEKMM